MGEVYLAQETRLGRPVAIKLLPEHLTNDISRLERFEQEACAASALSHPNVCTIFTTGDAPDGRRFIAMEYVPGRTLRQRLEGGPLHISEALDLANQIASGIAAAHAAGIIHRDLKPENILIRDDGLVKIIDFGVAKLVSSRDIAPDSEGPTRFAARTEAGSVIGSVGYMSPEQTRGQDVDARTDVWSVGVILYEMVTGRMPFAASSPSDIIVAVLDREPAPLTAFEPRAPIEVQRIIDKALKKNKENRYRAMTDVLQELGALDDTFSARSPGAGTYDVRGRRRLTVAVAVAICALAVLAAGGWTLWPRFFSAGPSIEPRLVRLTANPPELTIGSGQISPDGRYFAYSDPTGIQVQLIDTGDTQRIAETKGMEVRGWTNDSTRLLAATCDAMCEAWEVSLVGGVRRRSGLSWPSTDRVSPAADGSRWLMLTEAGDIEVDLLNGAPPKSILRTNERYSITAATWSADAERILFVRRQGPTIEAIPAVGGAPVVVFTAPQGRHVMAMRELRNRRLLVALGRELPVTDARISWEVSLWHVRADDKGVANATPERITEGRSEFIDGLSASADGKRLAFFSTSSQTDVYVASLDRARGFGSTPRRLTLDERSDLGFAFTQDGSAVLFDSSRNGSRDIFRQRLDADVAEPIVIGPGDQARPELTSDGESILYRDERTGMPPRIIRTSVSGGRSTVMLDATGNFQCAPRGRCVILEPRESDYAVLSLDGEGKASELARISRQIYGWNILPDGESLAYIPAASGGPRNRIHITSFMGHSERDISVENVVNLQNLDVLPDARGFFSTDVRTDDTRLIFIKPDGKSQVLWAPAAFSPLWAISSRDGKNVAITVAVSQRNAWLATF